MHIFMNTYKNSYIFKAISLCLILSFGLMSLVPNQAFAQTLQPVPTLLSPSFAPTLVRGIRVYPDNPFQFDFIVDSGDTGLRGDELKQESEKLIRYFLASLTLPENDLWVNLSPHEKDRIVPDELGSTEMGIDMLSQDYLLKQITASLTNPDSDLGKEFWQKVYKKAYEQYGTTNIPVDTFNKVWIMPDKATVYVQEDKAFITESRLKVMLEEDYIALQESQNEPQQPREPNNALASSVVREVFIPALEQEVNTGKNFAQLRQIYNCIILSYWYKTNLKGSILNKVYADQHKVKGIDLIAQEETQKIYSQYLDTFKQGVCNIMKVEYDPYAKKSIPRKYFAGGVDITHFGDGAGKAYHETKDKTACSAIINKLKLATIVLITAGFSLLGTKDMLAQDHDSFGPRQEQVALKDVKDGLMYEADEYGRQAIKMSFHEESLWQNIKAVAWKTAGIDLSEDEQSDLLNVLMEENPRLRDPDHPEKILHIEDLVKAIEVKYNLDHAKLIAGEHIQHGGKDLTVFFLDSLGSKPNKYADLYQGMNFDNKIIVFSFAIAQWIESAGKKYDHQARENVFFRHLQDVVRHESLHAILRDRIDQGLYQSVPIRDLFQKYSVPLNQYYRVTEEFGSYLGQLAQTENPRITLVNFLKKTDQLRKLNDVYWSVQSLILDEIFFHLGKDNWRENRNDFGGASDYDFLLSLGLADESFNAAAQELFEKYFGPLPLIDPKIPSEVLENYRTKYQSLSIAKNIDPEIRSEADDHLSDVTFHGSDRIPSDPLVLVDDGQGLDPVKKEFIVKTQTITIENRQVNVVFSREDRGKLGETSGRTVHVYLGSIVRNTKKAIDSVFAKNSFLGAVAEDGVMSSISSREAHLKLSVDFARLVLIHELTHQRRFLEEFSDAQADQLEGLFRYHKVPRSDGMGVALELEAYLSMLCSGDMAKLIFAKMLLMESSAEKGSRERYVSRVISRELLGELGYRAFVREHHPEKVSGFRAKKIYYDLDILKEFLASLKDEDIVRASIDLYQAIFLEDPIRNVGQVPEEVKGHIQENAGTSGSSAVFVKTSSPITMNANEGLKVLVQDIQKISQGKKSVLVAISGDSGVGKSIFCNRLAQEIPGARLVSADDHIKQRRPTAYENPSVGSKFRRYFDYQDIAQAISQEMAEGGVVIVEGFEISEVADTLREHKELETLLDPEKVFDVHVKLIADMERTRFQNLKEREFWNRHDRFIQGLVEGSQENFYRRGDPDYIFDNSLESRIALTPDEEAALESTRKVFKTEQEQGNELLQDVERILWTIAQKHRSYVEQPMLRGMIKDLQVLLVADTLDPDDRAIVLRQARSLVENYHIFEDQMRDVWVGAQAIDLLTQVRDERDVALFLAIAQDHQADIGGMRREAIAALGRYSYREEIKKVLEDIIKDPEELSFTRKDAQEALQRIAEQKKAAGSSALTPEEKEALAKLKSFLDGKKIYGFGEDGQDYTIFIGGDLDFVEGAEHRIDAYLVDSQGRRSESTLFSAEYYPLTKEFYIDAWNPLLSRMPFEKVDEQGKPSGDKVYQDLSAAFATSQALRILSQALPGFRVQGILHQIQIAEQNTSFEIFLDEETGFFKKLKNNGFGHYWILEDPQRDAHKIKLSKEDTVITPDQLVSWMFFNEPQAASVFESVDFFWVKQGQIVSQGFDQALHRLVKYYADSDLEFDLADELAEADIGDPLLVGFGSIEDFGEFYFEAEFSDSTQGASSSIDAIKSIVEDFIAERQEVLELNFSDFEGVTPGRFYRTDAFAKLKNFFDRLPFEAHLIDYSWKSKDVRDVTIDLALTEIVKNAFDALESWNDPRVEARLPDSVKNMIPLPSQRRISIGLEVVDGKVIFKVYDNGAGIYATTTQEKKEAGRYLERYGQGSKDLYYELKNINGTYALQKGGESGRSIREGSVATIEIPLAKIKARQQDPLSEDILLSQADSSSSSPVARLEAVRDAVRSLEKIIPIALDYVQVKMWTDNQRVETLPYKLFFKVEKDQGILSYLSENKFRFELTVDEHPIFFVRKDPESVDLLFGWTQQGYQEYFQRYISDNIEDFLYNVYSDNEITNIEVLPPANKEQFACFFDVVLLDGNVYEDHSFASLYFSLDLDYQARISFALGTGEKNLTNNEELFRALLPGMGKFWNKNNKDQLLSLQKGSSSVIARSGAKIYIDQKGRQRIDMATVKDEDLKDFLAGIDQPDLAGKVVIYGGAVRDLLFGSSVRDIDYFLTTDITEDDFRKKVFPRLQATTILKKHNMGERLRSLNDIAFRFGRTELSANKMFLYLDGSSPDPVLEDPQNGLKDLISQTARITNDSDERETREKFSRIMEKVIRFGLIPDGRAEHIFRDCILHYKGQLMDLPVFNVYKAWDGIVHRGVNEADIKILWDALVGWQDSYAQDMAADRPQGLNDGEGDLFLALGFKDLDGLRRHLENVLSQDVLLKKRTASSGISGRWSDVLPRLLDLADQKKVKAIYIDLDNTIFYPKGFVGSEKQKFESIVRVAVNLVIEELNAQEGSHPTHEMVARAIDQAKRLVYVRGDKDEERMVKNQFFVSDVDPESLKVLKKKGVRIIGFTARPSAPTKMRITLDILKAVGVNGDILDKVVFTSGDGKIKADRLAFEIKELRKEAKKESQQIPSREIFLIDDLKKNIIAAEKLGYGVTPVLIEPENGIVEKTWENFFDLGKQAVREENFSHAIEYFLNAYTIAPRSQEIILLSAVRKALPKRWYSGFVQALDLDAGGSKDAFKSREAKDIISPIQVSPLKGIVLEDVEFFVRDQLNKPQSFGGEYEARTPSVSSPVVSSGINLASDGKNFREYIKSVRPLILTASEIFSGGYDRVLTEKIRKFIQALSLESFQEDEQEVEETLEFIIEELVANSIDSILGVHDDSLSVPQEVLDKKRAQEHKITLSAEVDDQSLLIKISDSGLGVYSQNKDKAGKGDQKYKGSYGEALAMSQRYVSELFDDAEIVLALGGEKDRPVEDGSIVTIRIPWASIVGFDEPSLKGQAPGQQDLSATPFRNISTIGFKNLNKDYAQKILKDPGQYLLKYQKDGVPEEVFKTWDPLTLALMFNVVWVRDQVTGKGRYVLAVTEVGPESRKLDTWIITDGQGHYIPMKQQKWATWGSSEFNFNDYDTYASGTYAFFEDQQTGPIAVQGALICEHEGDASEWIEPPLTSRTVPEEKSEKKEELGGIDFNAENMNVRSTGDKMNFTLPVDADSEQLRSIHGLKPVIINIQPFQNLPSFLGLSESSQIQELSSL